MAMYQIPVTVLTTGDELLSLEMIYTTNGAPPLDQFKQNPTVFDDTVRECTLTPDAYNYAVSLTAPVTPNTKIETITSDQPSTTVLKNAGFNHLLELTEGHYHWIINGQKFLATITKIPSTNTVPVSYPEIVLKYLSGSYADIHPEYVGTEFRPFRSIYTDQLLSFMVPVSNVMLAPPAPHVLSAQLPGTSPYYQWDYSAADSSPQAMIYRELIYNIPQNQTTDLDIGKTYPEYDYNADGPKSDSLPPLQNPDIGDFDDRSEPIPPPDIDELNKNSAIGTGLISVYNPTIGQVAQLAQFLWSDLFSLDTFKKMFGSPMDAILSLHIIPVTPTIGTANSVVIGNVNTNITMSPITQQFISFNCGTVKIQSFFGSALDFSPFTKMSIFLPYIGVRELDIDEIMYKIVGVQYLFDILTGACNALITVDGDVRYQFSGSASLQMPINATSWTNVINNIMSLATATIATVASSGMAAGSLISAGANAVTNSKMNIERSGAVTGAAGFLGVQTPYLIRTIPRQSLAKQYPSFRGYPSNITAQLGSLSGYTEVEQVFLDGVTATEEEKTEILALLKGGVII